MLPTRVSLPSIERGTLDIVDFTLDVDSEAESPRKKSPRTEKVGRGHNLHVLTDASRTRGSTFPYPSRRSPGVSGDGGKFLSRNVSAEVPPPAELQLSGGFTSDIAESDASRPEVHGGMDKVNSGRNLLGY